MRPEERDRWTPIAGILAAVTFTVGMVFVSTTPGDKDSDAQVLAFYADRGHRVSAIVGAYLLAVCAPLLVWFGAGLRRRLLAAGDAGRFADLAFGAAILCAAFLGIGGAGLAAVPAAQSFGGTALSNADVARFLPAVGLVGVLVFAMIAAIALIVTVSIFVQRSGMLPDWVAWLGFLAALVLLLSVVFLPLIAFPLWLVLVSIALMRRPVGAAPTGPSPADGR
jgi:hypothetical protein